MPAMSTAQYPDLFAEMYNLLLDAAWIFLGWAGIDYVMEWRSREGRLRMSKQDLRDEYREMEGSPQIKARIRGLRRQMRRRQLKADVSRASVVVTNPTHYAVALSFDFDTMDPPRVLAKGRDLLAAQIREEARWAGVPIVENPPLARSLYRQVEQGQAIPYELYAAVAAILAWLYRREVEERVRRERAEAAAREKKTGRTGGTAADEGREECVAVGPSEAKHQRREESEDGEDTAMSAGAMTLGAARTAGSGTGKHAAQHGAAAGGDQRGLRHAGAAAGLVHGHAAGAVDGGLDYGVSLGRADPACS